MLAATPEEFTKLDLPSPIRSTAVSRSWPNENGIRILARWHIRAFTLPGKKRERLRSTDTTKLSIEALLLLQGPALQHNLLRPPDGEENP